MNERGRAGAARVLAMVVVWSVLPGSGVGAQDGSGGVDRPEWTDVTDGQDELGLLIDPFRDSRRAFGFNVNPFGVQKDRVFDREQGNDAWDAIWSSQGRLTDSGWEVEAAIPFASLRFPAGTDVQSWGFFIWRARPRAEAVSLRSVPRDPSNQCALCQMAIARGIEVDGRSLGVELAPYFTLQRTDARPSTIGAALATGDVIDEYGVDARWSVTSDATVNLTVNPDFSQVEADAPQILSNQQFAIFYPERRPFFLEGAELFETPFRAVFTRTIADPSAGGKVSGKAGGWAFGALAARDERTNLLFPGPQASVSALFSEANTAAMLRARRDLGDASTAGALATIRTAANGYQNVVGGLDARIRLTPTTTLTGQVLGSQTTYPAEVAEAFGQPTEALGGWAAKAQIGFADRDGSLDPAPPQLQAQPTKRPLHRVFRRGPRPAREPGPARAARSHEALQILLPEDELRVAALRTRPAPRSAEAARGGRSSEWATRVIAATSWRNRAPSGRSRPRGAGRRSARSRRPGTPAC